MGFVHIKDILRAIEHSSPETTQPTARELARDVPFVPEDRRIDAILAVFQKRESQMAVIIDEWGEFEGIVTIEDILEEIVGEIRDEFDIEALEPSITKLDSGAYSVDGHIPIGAVNEAMGTNFESEDFETIGGLVLSELGRAPEVDDQVKLDGYTLHVDEVENTRISQITIQIVEHREQEP
jgi:CBS domain containing-hemolysin-like protein